MNVNFKMKMLNSLWGFVNEIGKSEEYTCTFRS